MTRTITFTGARGGHGTTTVAAVVALHAARTAPTVLVSPDTDAACALLGASGGHHDGRALRLVSRYREAALRYLATPNGTKIASSTRHQSTEARTGFWSGQ